MIVHKEGSLFDAPKGSILVHAVNAQGMWGSGIALEFKKRFPGSYWWYRQNVLSRKFTAENGYPVGYSFLCPEENGYIVGCLVTSWDYGTRRDTQDVILKQTETALKSLMGLKNVIETPVTICSNKFNSGLFGVPWSDTESILESIVLGYKGDWIVYSESSTK